jgi:hypothetical protein
VIAGGLRVAMSTMLRRIPTKSEGNRRSQETKRLEIRENSGRANGEAVGRGEDDVTSTMRYQSK